MSDDKDLPPSEKKLRKALEENQDQQSDEINGLAALVGLGALFYAFTPGIIEKVVPLLRLETFDFHNLDDLNGTIVGTLVPLAGLAERGAVVLLAGALGAGLLGNILNRRRPPSLKMPSPSYNPLSHLKQMFGLSSVLAVVKLWVIGILSIAAIGFIAWQQLPIVAYGVYATPASGGAIASHMFTSVLPVVVGLAAVSAIIDAMQKVFDFIKENKMDHEEVKQENKDDNGDPMIKSKRLELMRG